MDGMSSSAGASRDIPIAQSTNFTKTTPETTPTPTRRTAQTDEKAQRVRSDSLKGQQPENSLPHALLDHQAQPVETPLLENLMKGIRAEAERYPGMRKASQCTRLLPSTTATPKSHDADNSSTVVMDTLKEWSKGGVLTTLSQMNKLIFSKEEMIPQDQLTKLVRLNNTLPQQLQLKVGNPSARSEWQTAFRKGANYNSSGAVGGHGGTMILSIGSNHLFLKPLKSLDDKPPKPLDDIEAKNYSLISKHANKLTRFMPKTYGTFNIEGTTYLVMENTRLTQDRKTLKQLADLKLAGQVPGIDNPICDLDEIKETERTKGTFDYQQMKFGAKQAPDFQFIVKSKAARLINFRFSKTHLAKVLVNLSQPHRDQLLKSLDEMREALQTSDVAFIGASIILVQSTDGSVHPKLIDPAHMQFNPDRKSEVAVQDRQRVYFGTAERFQLWKQSNLKAIDAIYTTIEQLSPYTEQKRLSDPGSVREEPNRPPGFSFGTSMPQYPKDNSKK